MTEPQEPSQIDKPRPGKLRRAGHASLWALALVIFVVAGAVVWLMDRPVAAPAWVQDRIEERIAQEMPAARVSFGEMVFLMERGWKPRVRLRDVRVETLEGAEIAAFSEFKAQLSMRSLLRRQIQPRAMSLTGVFASLRRHKDGTVTLSAGTGLAPPSRQAATLAELVAQIDNLMTAPALAALRQVEIRALTLRFDDLRAERGWTVDGGRLILSRTGDDLALSADLAILGGGAGAATLAANYASRIGETEAQFGMQFDGVSAVDIATQNPAFAWMEVLRAPISGAVRSGVNASGKLAPLNATLQIGAGVVQPNDGTKPIPFQGARSYFSYDAADGLLRFDELSLSSKWVSGRAEGTAQLSGIREGRLDDLVGQFRLTGLSANPQELYPQPIGLEAAEMDFRLQLDPFRIDLGRLQITDQASTVQAEGQVRATPEGWQLALDARLDAMAPDRLLALWPVRLKTKTRNWLVQNLLEGDIRNGDLALRLAPGQAPRTYLAFDYERAKVRFMKSLPPITEGRGHASLDANRFVISLDAGKVVAPEGGPVTIDGSSFILPDVTVKGGTPAVIRLTTRSNLTAALSLLNEAPLNVMDKVGLPVALADGQAVMTGTLSLPLRKGTKPSDVSYDVSGDLLALETNRLVKGRLLRSERMSVVAHNREIRIGGKGLLDGVPFDGTWAQPIGKGSDRSALNGRVTLSPEALDTFKIALPPGTVSGTGQGDLALVFQKGVAPEFRLTSDLRGLRLNVPQLSWSKPADVPGRLEVTGALGVVPRVDGISLSGAGLSATAALALRTSGGLERLRVTRLQLGDWLDVPVDLVGQGAGRAPQVVIRGGTLDLRRAQFGASSGSSTGPPAPPMLVALDRLQITDTVALTAMRGSFKTAQGLDGPFEAQLNGGTAIRGQVVPREGRSAVRILSDDAGGVFRSAGVLKQAVGGEMSLTLLPVGSGGAFDGRLQVKQTRIKDAPAMAALLNAVSVVGLLEQLSGEGIYFDDVEAEFRLTPNRVTLSRASAVGSSMGISMDGVFATDTGQINMQGVVSPVYLINGLGSILTRKGEGLIGFNYALTGQAKAPKVSVNPLSALTPGMFRDIFRAPPPKLPEVDGVAKSTLPANDPAPQREVAREHEGR